MNEFIFKLLRFSSQVESTEGLLMAGSALADQPNVRDSFRGFTLEDEYRAVKVAGETRIPAGRYEIKLRTDGGMHSRYSQKYEWHRGMLWLQDVPSFEWVYIHPLNDDTQTEGCIGVGDGCMSNLPRVGRGSLSYSMNCYKALALEVYDLMDKGVRVFIEIKDID